MTTTCTMILGDCLEVMPTLAKLKVNLCACDFPYGCTDQKWDAVLDSRSILRLMNNVSSSTCLFLTFANESFLFTLRQNWNIIFNYSLIWNKNRGSNFFLADRRPMVGHEFIGVWGKGVCYNPQMRTGFIPNYRVEGTVACEFLNKGLRKKGTIIRTGSVRYPLAILDFPKDKSHRRRGKNVRLAKAHGAQKPVALLDWLIRTYSNAGDLVMDPTSGSGTAAVSACQNGRSVVCIEKDEGYFEASVERVRKHVRDNLLDVKLEVRK